MLIEDGDMIIKPSPNRFEVLADHDSHDSSIPSEGEEHLFTDHSHIKPVVNGLVRLT